MFYPGRDALFFSHPRVEEGDRDLLVSVLGGERHGRLFVVVHHGGVGLGLQEEGDQFGVSLFRERWRAYVSSNAK